MENRKRNERLIEKQVRLTRKNQYPAFLHNNQQIFPILTDFERFLIKALSPKYQVLK